MRGGPGLDIPGGSIDEDEGHRDGSRAGAGRSAPPWRRRRTTRPRSSSTSGPASPRARPGTIGEEKAKTRSGRPDGRHEPDQRLEADPLGLPRPTATRTPAWRSWSAPAAATTTSPGTTRGSRSPSWLNSIGVTAAVLKYRVPRREGTPRGEPPPQALMDAQRALSLVRTQAEGLGDRPQAGRHPRLLGRRAPRRLGLDQLRQAGLRAGRRRRQGSTAGPTSPS